MHREELFTLLRTDLEKKIRFLEDKPEENIDSSLKALWHKAAGNSVSSEYASALMLPELTDQQVDTLHKLIELRIKDIPLAHITGRQSFMGIELLSDKRALIPRKETELLGKKAVELSVELAKVHDKPVVIDVCCGSGNLGLAIARFNLQCIVLLTDISQDAADLARENAELLEMGDRITVKQGDLLNAYDLDEYHEKIDMIVCNPPYISSAKVAKMNIETAAHEPAMAFDGGMLGTGIIQKLIREAPRFLKPEGWLIFEVGAGQGDFIAQLCERTQLYRRIETVSDHLGIIRVIVAQKK